MEKYLLDVVKNKRLERFLNELRFSRDEDFKFTCEGWKKVTKLLQLVMSTKESIKSDKITARKV